MWPGGACTAILDWLNNTQEMLINREDLPQLVTVVVVRLQMEKSSITQDFPVAKAAYSLLKDSVSSSFCFAGWNKGRIIRQNSQLKRILSSTDPSSEVSDMNKIVALSNSPFPHLETKTSMGEFKQRSSSETEVRIRTNTELMPSAA